jgi:hypothetical protein
VHEIALWLPCSRSTPVVSLGYEADADRGSAGFGGIPPWDHAGTTVGPSWAWHRSMLSNLCNLKKMAIFMAELMDMNADLRYSHGSSLLFACCFAALGAFGHCRTVRLRKLRRFACVLAILLIASSELSAQSDSVHLYVQKIDSILASRRVRDYFLVGWTQKEALDSIHNKRVVGVFKDDELDFIANMSLPTECETIVFHFAEHSLVAVDYILADADVRSMPPPSTFHRIYYRDGQVMSQSTADYDGGARGCDSFSVDKKDFLSELAYYKHLVMQD